jgi:hypothetical protein
MSEPWGRNDATGIGNIRAYHLLLGCVEERLARLEVSGEEPGAEEWRRRVGRREKL